MRIWTQAKVVEVERSSGFKGRAKIWVTTGMQRVRKKRGYWRFWVGNCAKSGQGGEGVRVRSSLSFFKKKFFFLMCTILKVFLEFVTILFLFYLFIWCKACEILAPTLGIEPTPPASEVLTTSLPGKYPRSSNAVSWVWGTPRSPAWRPCMPPQSLASFSVYEWWVIIDNGYWCLLCARCGSKYFMCDN